jgi:hypothetical protein
VSFRVHDTGTGRTWITYATNLYTARQWRAMATEPELIRQAAHEIARQQARRGRTVEVRADAFMSLNGRAARRIVDRTIDLAREPYRIHQPWILPAPTSRPSSDGERSARGSGVTVGITEVDRHAELRGHLGVELTRELTHVLVRLAQVRR